jgi:hypothetical protein
MHDRNMTWAAADGRRVKLKDMSDSHLVNVVNWILDNHQLYPVNILDNMVEEARYRQTLLFAEGKSYPQLIGTRWKLVDPKTGVGKIVPPPKEYIEAVKDNEAYQRMSKLTQEKRKKQS